MHLSLLIPFKIQERFLYSSPVNANQCLISYSHILANTPSTYQPATFSSVTHKDVAHQDRPHQSRRRHMSVHILPQCLSYLTSHADNQPPEEDVRGQCQGPRPLCYYSAVLHHREMHHLLASKKVSNFH